jgi:putative transposase
VEQSRRREIALFRYSLVRGPGDPRVSRRERGRQVRALAAAEHVGPDGELVRVGRSTLDKWIVAWQQGGFDGLVPRAPVVGPRTPAVVLELAAALKRELPVRTVAQVRQIMLAAGQPTPSASTIERHFRRLGLNTRPDGRPPQAYGRFEAAGGNELWQGDGLHGPRLGGRRAVLVAFIDDHSRLLVGYRWGAGENVLGLEAALRMGLAARGVPDAILVDRGSAFVSSQLLRACAVLGVRLIHAAPRAATTKGKIERFFRTVRGQFMVELERRPVTDLDELNRLFGAWVERVYHQAVHSETKQTPLARFMTDGAPALPTAELLREAFLWSETRTVSKTATVSLHGNLYEVDPVLVGQRCELVYDPFDLERIEVRYQRRPVGLAVPVRIDRQTHPRVAPEPPPAASTGIDYLRLLAAQRDDDLAPGRTDFAALDPHSDDDDGDDGDDGDGAGVPVGGRA